MSKIVKNTTVSSYTVSDVGITIPASDQYTIPAQDYLLWADSDDAVTGIGSSDLVVNDGSTDLSISDGTNLIKGIWPNPVGIAAGTDGTAIGSVGDRLKVDTADSSDAVGVPVYSPAYRWRINRDSDVLDDTYFTVYTRSGTGKFAGINLRFTNANTQVKLSIDGSVIVEADVGDIEYLQVNGNTNDLKGMIGLYWNNGSNILGVQPAWPIEYLTELKVEAKKASTGAAPSVNGYVLALTEES